ncbi:Abi family protein [Corynebacterium suedekumii]|nr:Abi family protein [Corynebacterium suedekumii]
MSYAKPYLTVPEQLDLLRVRGCDIGDQASAEELLTRVGYYRLSGYWYPFRQSSQVNGETVVLDNFISGTTLSAISELYEFDRRLRLLVLDAIERVEVAMRFQVGHTLGSRGALRPH